jgi:glycosyltransferase involved in cell wall biosynthesis
MLITIAIPTYNRSASLAATLPSVLALSIPGMVTCELLVVDNASTDDTQKVVANAAASAPFAVRSVVESQPGLCHGRNRALTEAQGEHVVFFDDDVNVARDWLHGYLDAVESGADCVVGPVTPVYSGPLPEYATPSVLALIGSDYSRKGTVTRELPPEIASEVPGCNFGVRRNGALAIGGFQTDLDRIGSSLLAGGDTEFGIRLVKHEKKVIYEPRCAIDHLIDAVKLTREHLRRRAAGLGRTAAKIREKHDTSLTAAEKLHQLKRGLGCWRRWQWLALTGETVSAFEWELRTRRRFAELVSEL